VVEDSKVDQVVSTIAESAHTGTLGDGKIFISTIDKVIDITTKEKVEKISNWIKISLKKRSNLS